MTRSLSDDDKDDAPAARTQGSLTEKLAFKSRFVLVFGEVTIDFNAWMYVNWRYCGVSCDCEQLVSGLGTTVCALIPLRETVPAFPPHARICCESAVARAWMREMSAACSAVASSNLCCSAFCCDATFELTAVCS